MLGHGPENTDWAFKTTRTRCEDEDSKTPKTRNALILRSLVVNNLSRIIVKGNKKVIKLIC